MSQTTTIRPFEQADLTEILRLNEESVSVLSPMDSNRFNQMATQTRIIWVASIEDEIAGFIMGFDDSSHYDSTNYGWFKSRYKNFLYIDRVVINKAWRGHGIGQNIYAELQNWCDNNNIERLVAEVDIEPPNEGSLKFHKLGGFEEVGQLRSSPVKCVSMQMKLL